jgi:hypothetical protein
LATCEAETSSLPSSWWATPKSVSLTIGPRSSLRDEHVAGVQVGVHEAAVVQVLERHQELPRDLDDQAGARGPVMQRAQARVALFEGEIEEEVHLEGVVDVDDVRVAVALEALHLGDHSSFTTWYGLFAGRSIFSAYALVEGPDALVD